jgi:hypothetical protein
LTIYCKVNITPETTGHIYAQRTFPIENVICQQCTFWVTDKTTIFEFFSGLANKITTKTTNAKIKLTKKVKITNKAIVETYQKKCVAYPQEDFLYLQLCIGTLAGIEFAG